MHTTSKKQSSTEAFGTVGKKSKVCLLVLIKYEDMLASGSESSISTWQIRNIITSKLLRLLALCLYVVPFTHLSLPQRTLRTSLSRWLPSSGWNQKMFNCFHIDKMQWSAFQLGRFKFFPCVCVITKVTLCHNENYEILRGCFTILYAVSQLLLE